MATQHLHTRIADQLARDIAEGRFPLGSTLPTELELAAQFNVSRATVRTALTSLQARKLVSRRKNSGTRVEATTPSGGYGATLTSLSDLVQWAKACERVVQSNEELVLDQELARELKCDPGSRWVRVQSLRFDGGKEGDPVSWTDAYIDIRYAGALPLILGHPSVLMSEQLEQQFGLNLAVVEQEVTGCKINTDMAVALRTTTNSPGLKIARRYLTEGGKPALVTVSTHPADRFSIRTRLSRN
jgi:GntR family transcriptional regulator